MKSLLIAIPLVTVAFATTGAADMGMPMKASPPPAPLPYSWTGCYIGVNGGGGIQHDTFTTEYGDGAIAGGQIGCNYQTGLLVLGIEGEGFWSGLQTQYNDNDPSDDGYSENYTTKNKWDADIAARFGLAWDRALVYGKAGVVWGRFGFGASQSYTGYPNYYTYNAPDTTFTGMLIGLGLEYAFLPNWTTKFEVDYLGFPTKDIAFNEYKEGYLYDSYSYSISAQKVLFKFGVNYKFGGPY
jgi:outer membrane immunogenic protein